jgi:hypothetical protein
LAICAAILALACAATQRAPDDGLASVWHDYRSLPAQRALAVAGDLRLDRWVAGASGGHATRAAELMACPVVHQQLELDGSHVEHRRLLQHLLHDRQRFGTERREVLQGVG